MSTINVTNLSGRGGATPNLPDGANITGVATASGGFSGTLTGTGLTTGSDGSINVTSIKTVGVSTLGNVVITGAVGGGATIGAYAGVTTFYGDGSSLTGVGESIAPWHYNPNVGDTGVMLDELTLSGIGITFNKKVVQGSSGTATLKIVNAGVAGTTIQSWGISSTTYDLTAFNLDANVSNIVLNQTYQVDIPSGFIVDTTGAEFVGTAWTFTATGPVGKLFVWGSNAHGRLGLNQPTPSHKSSPTQVPGIGWSKIAEGGNRTNNYGNAALKDDGTLWSWGYNYNGRLAQNNTGGYYSSPVQIPGTTWKHSSNAYGAMLGSKTDGTLWGWGFNYFGQLGQNEGPAGNPGSYSSPVQIHGDATNWNGAQYTFKFGIIWAGAIKTDGTLWTWGKNEKGQLGQNAGNNVHQSSPTQIPGTTWSIFSGNQDQASAIKTDGTLWMWGKNDSGALGLNQAEPGLAATSSPVQVPGTTWRNVNGSGKVTLATKTDGTLWVWGRNGYGELGQNDRTYQSSPTQIPGTWNKISASLNSCFATKTDGTMWAWGYGDNGQGVGGVPGIGEHMRSSPTQIPGTEWTGDIGSAEKSSLAIHMDPTP